jgi:hypothetical protein
LAADKSQSLLLVIGAVVVLIGGAAWWFLGHPSAGEPRPVLTPEARAYLKNLALSEVQMQANESYLKQAVVEFDGKITNKGDRVVKLVEINCIFHDNVGLVVLRERVAIAGRKAGDLRPGDTKSFRLAFDSIPESLNNQMPDLVIAQIRFE